MKARIDAAGAQKLVEAYEDEAARKERFDWEEEKWDMLMDAIEASARKGESQTVATRVPPFVIEELRSLGFDTTTPENSHNTYIRW